MFASCTNLSNLLLFQRRRNDLWGWMTKVGPSVVTCRRRRNNVWNM